MTVATEKRAVLIAGPTASGKSALALAKARALGGIIVNTDAMQVYSVLGIVTARPSPVEMGDVPHRLYGTVPPAERFSTGAWLRAVAEVMAEAGDRPLIFVGGTGLYFDALSRGFADVPPVPAAVVKEVEAELAGLDRQARGRLIAERDPETAALLQSSDPQRVVRALAVLKATGRPLASFQQGAQRGLLEDFMIDRILLDPPREVLRDRIGTRFEAMLEGGAVEEVEALLRMSLDPSLPAMKAIGVREIAEWRSGAIDREEAVRRAVTATRQYAKRQRTWFRSRMVGWTVVNPLADA